MQEEEDVWVLVQRRKTEKLVRRCRESLHWRERVEFWFYATSTTSIRKIGAQILRRLRYRHRRSGWDTGGPKKFPKTHFRCSDSKRVAFLAFHGTEWCPPLSSCCFNGLLFAHSLKQHARHEGWFQWKWGDISVVGVLRDESMLFESPFWCEFWSLCSEFLVFEISCFQICNVNVTMRLFQKLRSKSKLTFIWKQIYFNSATLKKIQAMIYLLMTHFIWKSKPQQ